MVMESQVSMVHYRPQGIPRWETRCELVIVAMVMLPVDVPLMEQSELLNVHDNIIFQFFTYIFEFFVCFL